MTKNRLTELFQVRYPLVSGGMVWCSGWRLAAAVSNAGGLGLIGAGSMHPDVLQEHIRKVKAATDKPFGVNVPLLYPEIDKIMDIIAEENVNVVFTSAGNPKTWTSFLKNAGITVVHVVSSSKFAVKAEDSGVDAIVAEGFEAGGHNGREETTTFTLIPQVRRATSLPLLAAGGIASGNAMLAAMVLGAEGVQIGTAFALSEESSAHIDFKTKALALPEGETIVCLKKLTPVRLIKNDFYKRVEEAENAGKNSEFLRQLLGRGRSKKGIFEGNLTEGELEIGQVASSINDIKPVKQIVDEIIEGFNQSASTLKDMRFD